MRSRAELVQALLDHAHTVLTANLRTLTADEALGAAGGYRSILGILKHTAAWTHVYHSFAFAPVPTHWRGLTWPGGLPADVVDTSPGYLDEVTAWLEQGYAKWSASLSGLPDGALDEPRPVHWRATMPLSELVVMVAGHWLYHAGEVNAILAIGRGEAWEYTEEVEENHISTAGHRVRPGWMSGEQARQFEASRARRDAELHAGR